MRVIIVPNAEMDTPHFEVLRVRSGDEPDTLSYHLPRTLEALKEAEAAEAPQQERVVKKREEPVLQGFAAPTEPAAAKKIAPAKKESIAKSEEEKPNFFSRIFSALANLFSGSPEAEAEQQPKEESQGNRSRRDNRRGDRQDSRRGERQDKRQDSRRGKDGARQGRKRQDTDRDNRDGEQRDQRQQRRRNEKPKQDRQQQQQDKAAKPQRPQHDEEAKEQKRQSRREEIQAQKQRRQEEKPNKAEKPVTEEKREQEQEKATKVKQRRQRRQLRKKIRIGDEQEAAPIQNQQAEPVAEENKAASPPLQELGTSVAKEAFAQEPQAEMPQTEEQAEQSNEQENGQRRNRRSPRHLRASGQRRRRIRDTRPEKAENVDTAVTDAVGHAVEEASDALNDMENVVSVVEKPKTSRPASGVASPEMAMGKVWAPAPKPAVEAVTPHTEAAEQPVSEVKAEAPVLGGVAMPELAMGKAFPLRAPADVEIVSEEAATGETVTEEVVTESPAVAEVQAEPVIEAPVVEDVKAEEPVHASEVADVIAPVAVETAVTEEPVAELNVETTSEEDNTAVTVTSPRGRHAVAPMVKAPAPEKATSALLLRLPLYVKST